MASGNDYIKGYYKSINIPAQAAWIDSVKAYCTARGIKVNTFIKSLIDKEMQLHPIDQYTTEPLEPLVNATKTPVESFVGDCSISVQGKATNENNPITDVNRRGIEERENSLNAAMEKAVNDMKTEIIDGIIAAMQQIKGQ